MGSERETYIPPPLHVGCNSSEENGGLLLLISHFVLDEVVGGPLRAEAIHLWDRA